MLTTNVLTIQTESGKRDIYVSPFLLQSKKAPNLKSGTFKLTKLYFYHELKDNDYFSGLGLQDMVSQSPSEEYVINYGQDFGKYYLGSLNLDFDSKRYWQWESESNIFTEQDVKILAESLFNPNPELRRITIMTPTRPSDFNFGIGNF